MDTLLADLCAHLESAGIVAFRRKGPPGTRASDAPFTTLQAHLQGVGEGKTALVIELDTWAYDTDTETGLTAVARVSGEIRAALEGTRTHDWTEAGTSAPLLLDAAQPMDDPDDLEIARINSVYSAGTFQLIR